MKWNWVIHPLLLWALSLPAFSHSFKASDDAPFGRAEAAHLLRRAGFGGNPDQIEFLAGIGRDKAVDYLVDYENVPLADEPYPLRENDARPLERRLLSDLDEDDRRELTVMIRRLNDQHMQGVRNWWCKRMVVTGRPLQEKMTLFWHGHFTSGFREVRNWKAMYEQNEFLRENALGDLKTLLLGISQDPAMIIYLDNVNNVKTHPNENYARELMELFTLGEGEYTERDITEAARAFTGWGLEDGEYRFYPRRHDFGNKTIFGMRGRWNGDDVIKILLKHPKCSRYLAERLLDFFVYRDAEPEVVEDLASILRRSGFDFRETMRTLLTSDLFYGEKAMHSQIKSPVELVIGAVRALEIDSVNPRGMFEACSRMGQSLFQPPNVKGWDGAEKWITTSTVFARYNFGRALVGEVKARPNRRTTIRGTAAKDAPGKGDGGAGPMMMDEMEMRPTLGEIAAGSVATAPYNPAPTIRKHDLETPEEIVQHYASRLLSTELSRPEIDTLVQALSPGEKPFHLDDPDAASRIHDLICLIMSMPEYQLN